jgi:hypothetical protein
VKGSNTFGQRYATQAATNRAAADTASLTVERYFTVTAEGNGESFNIQSNTPSAGNKIVRKIWYKDEAFEDTDVDTWTLLHTFADDTAYASTATKWQEYLDGQSNGTPPFTLAISWEDVPAVTGILDGYTADLGVAYSPALLDINYAGSAIRVRRASDNTEQDIGFDGTDLDTAALTTFCTGTDCFIRTWYDQSGNTRNLTQTTTANQPKIYDSSTGVNLTNALASLRFDGSNDVLKNINNGLLNNVAGATIFAVVDSDQTTQADKTALQIAFTGGFSRVILRHSTTTAQRFDIGGRRVSADSLQFITSNTSTTAQVIMTGVVNYTDTDLTLYQNGTQVAQSLSFQTSSNSAATNSDIGVGATVTDGSPFIGTIQAIIVYSADKSADRAAIETALNDYFNVY